MVLKDNAEVPVVMAPEMAQIVAPPFPAQEMRDFCGTCDRRPDRVESPGSRADREEAKRVLEERLRRDWGEKDRLKRRVEEWFTRQGGARWPRV